MWLNIERFLHDPVLGPVVVSKGTLSSSYLFLDTVTWENTAGYHQTWPIWAEPPKLIRSDKRSLKLSMRLHLSLKAGPSNTESWQSSQLHFSFNLKLWCALGDCLSTLKHFLNLNLFKHFLTNCQGFLPDQPMLRVKENSCKDLFCKLFVAPFVASEPGCSKAV